MFVSMSIFLDCTCEEHSNSSDNIHKLFLVYLVLPQLLLFVLPLNSDM